MKKINIILAMLVVLAITSCGKDSSSVSNIINDSSNNYFEGSSSHATSSTSSSDDNEVASVDFNLPTLFESADYNSDEEILIDLANQTITNNNGFVVFEDNILYILSGGSYTLSGDYEGRIIISGEDEEVEVILDGVSISSDEYAPIVGYNLGNLKITAKKGSENIIKDLREEEGSFNSAIYADCDLDFKGKGILKISSTLNNGIHTKDDLKIKNLTLNVTAPNYAIKGNDSVTIEEANVLAISSSGDAIKTTNSDISSKGNQRGTVTINGATVSLYAALDGIDAAYDVVFTNSPNINIKTDSYSDYSNYVSDAQSSTFYVGLDNNISAATLIVTLSDGGIKELKGASVSSGFGRNYLSFSMPTDAKSFKIIAQARGESYETDDMNINNKYDCISLTLRNGSLMTSFETYQTAMRPGGVPGGMGPGGMQDGNSNKSDYSSKGIKADNTITIDSGNIQISSHDDGIHANADVTLENGKTGLGNILILGGNVEIISDDDGIHADYKLDITGGYIVIKESYEALEGNIITFDGGVVEANASDDGINATNKIEDAYIYFKSGTVYVNASGDGLDSNGYIVMTGGNVIAIGPTDSGNGVLDFDRTFTITGGNLLLAGCSGMNQKPTLASGVSGSVMRQSNTYGKYLTLTVDSKLTLELYVSKNNINYIVYAGYGKSSSVSINSTSSFSGNIYGVA